MFLDVNLFLFVNQHVSHITRSSQYATRNSFNKLAAFFRMNNLKEFPHYLHVICGSLKISRDSLLKCFRLCHLLCLLVTETRESRNQHAPEDHENTEDSQQVIIGNSSIVSKQT